MLSSQSQARQGEAPAAGGRVAQGISAATVAMVAWGFSGVLVVLIKLPGMVVALYRLWLGAPFIGLLLIASRRRLSWATLWRAIPGGVLLCGDISMFFSAVKLTSIADASVIGALQPALVLFLARPLFGERVMPTDVAWTAVAIAGVGIVVLGGGSAGTHPAAGDLLAFGSLCAWTGYWLVSKHVRSPARATPGVPDGGSGGGSLGSIEYTSGVMLVAAVAIIPVALASGARLSLGTPSDWLWLGVMTVVPGSAHLALNWAHRFVSVSVSSVIVSVSPVVAAASAAVVLGQSLDFLQIAGGLVAILAVAMVARRAARLDGPEGPGA